MIHNFQKMLDNIIENLGESKPKLLLHCCCAPCSSYVLEYLARYFEITLLFYNPNISPKEEFFKRYKELKNLLNQMGENSIQIILPEYNPDEFFEIAKELEQVPEGGERCYKCYRLRLEKTAEIARQKGFDYFCSTLSISPYKNAKWLNEIGEQLGEIYATQYLPNDFKKKNGYKRSIELSAKYNLYRQNYCGCVYSKIEREKAEKSLTLFD